MDSLAEAIARNNRAVLREWREARDEGNALLADSIRRANPDLFDDHGEPVWARTQLREVLLP